MSVTRSLISLSIGAPSMTRSVRKSSLFIGPAIVKISISKLSALSKSEASIPGSVSITDSLVVYSSVSPWLSPRELEAKGVTLYDVDGVSPEMVSLISDGWVSISVAYTLWQSMLPACFISHPAVMISSPPRSMILNFTIIPSGPVESVVRPDTFGGLLGIVVNVIVFDFNAAVSVPASI